LTGSKRSGYFKVEIHVSLGNIHYE
jgi:hypothetical protein